MDTQYTYIIGGKKYTQAPLVLGQWALMQALLMTLRMPATFDLPGIIAAFGGDIHNAMAIALVPEGGAVEHKADPAALEALAKTLQWTADVETTQKVVTDFFACNPTHSLLEKMTEMLGRVTALIGQAREAQGTI
jgi:hypothetical protein